MLILVEQQDLAVDAMEKFIHTMKGETVPTDQTKNTSHFVIYTGFQYLVHSQKGRDSCTEVHKRRNLLRGGVVCHYGKN